MDVTILTPYFLSDALVRELRDVTNHAFTGGMRMSLSRYLRCECSLLVAHAIVGGRTVGWSCVEIRKGHIPILHVYVRRAYRRLGYGTRLVDAVLQQVRERSPSVRRLMIREDIATPHWDSLRAVAERKAANDTACYARRPSCVPSRAWVVRVR